MRKHTKRSRYAADREALARRYELEAARREAAEFLDERPVDSVFYTGAAIGLILGAVLGMLAAWMTP